MSRVLKDDPMFSVPAHADRWTEFDDWVGHARRYEPAELLAITARNRQAPPARHLVDRAPPQLCEFLVQKGPKQIGKTNKRTSA